MLAEPITRQIMKYQLKNAGHSFTTSSLSSKMNLEFATTQEVLDKLVNYSFIKKTIIDAGNENLIEVYSLYGGPKMLLVYSIIRIAGRLAHYKDSYRGFRGVPNDWFC